ncbi:MAG: hypothetical protein U1E14_04995 [Geminicoccaceae bacterium]
MDRLRSDGITSLATLVDDGLPELAAGRRILYLGSRARFAGRIGPSDDGRYGPGLYLTSLGRARRLPAAYPGVIFACDVTDLSLLALDSPEAYRRRLEGLRGGRRIPDALARLLLQAMLLAKGYDGVQVVDDAETEALVFPSQVRLLRLAPV